jgi:hypothetical protein
VTNFVRPVSLPPQCASDMAAGANAVGAAIAAALAGVGPGGDPAAARVSDLEQQQRDLTAARRANARDLRNEQKKRKRLQEKARSLSTDDLQDILIARAAAGAKAKARPKPKAKAKAAAAAAAGGDDPAAAAAVDDPAAAAAAGDPAAAAAADDPAAAAAADEAAREEY